MSGFVQSLWEAVGTSNQTFEQLLTDPAQLSCDNLVVLGACSVCVTVAVLWACSGEEFRTQKVKVRADFTPGKGKLPWIEYNGQAMGDSNLIIEFLNKEKGVDLNRSDFMMLTGPSTAPLLRCWRRTHIGWGGAKCKMIDNQDKIQELWQVSWFIFYFYLKPAVKVIKKNMWAHGIGRHSDDELEAIVKKDLRALSDFLGSKLYLMGDEPTEADAAVFGFLAQILWTMPGTYMYRIVTEDCLNLQAYTIRMKERYWPDWDQLTGNTKKDQ
uniref:GST C-terminal domain-containing protein n=1 Tax=Branchiostoma floridae TaxID=7739 RepID=C3ZJH2_BRAFL|eukprot:XP_002591303.1 hypothetical protein BRAFLDRAFT_76753 [Branchiostoma floridae]